MGGRNGRREYGRATLFDALTPEVLAKLESMRAELENKAQRTIERRLQGSAGSQPKNLPQQRSPTLHDPNVRIARPKQKASRPPRPIPPAPVEKPKRKGYSLVKPKVTVTSTRPEARASTRAPRVRPATIVSEAPNTFRYWKLPLEAPVREAPPTHIDPADAAQFETILSYGGPEESSSELELFATIGLDFGTSSTKIIVRFPYEPGEPTIAIPAPRHCLSDGDPYLWKTVLWLRDDGEFAACPVHGAQLLHSLKQGIVLGKALLPCIGKEYRGLKVTRADAATAYLAFVIRYVRGWLKLNRPATFTGRTASWFVNLGLPAENADNGQLSGAYRRVAAAALLAADYDGPIDIEVTNIFLEDKAVLSAATSMEEASIFGVAVIAETVAEAAGFAKSNQSAPDLYVMVDVGAMTLDICAFRLHRWKDGDDQYALLNGLVRPLGVEAMYWFLGQGESESAFREQCERSLKEVIWTTKTDKDPHARCWQTGNDLSVFLVGGGAKSRPHVEVAQALSPWLRQYTEGEGIRFLSLPEPRGVDCPDSRFDFGRMAVAWGLSYPEDQIGSVLPLSANQDVPGFRESHWSDAFVSKDQV